MDEPIQLAGVLADDFVADLWGQVAQFALDELARVRPHSVRVGEVRTPHDGIVSQIIEKLDADAITLVGGSALAAPVLARPHGEAQVLELVLPFRVHTVQYVGYPADPALADHDLDVAVTLEHAGEDHRYQRRGHV